MSDLQGKFVGLVSDKRVMFVVIISLATLFLQQRTQQVAFQQIEVKSDFPEIHAVKNCTTLKTEIVYESETDFMKRMKTRMKQRRAVMREGCKKLGLPKEPFRKQLMMEARRYNFLYCRVPKAGSSHMDGAFVNIVDVNDYPRTKKVKLNINTNPHQIEFITQRYFEDMEEISNHKTIILVRDPFLRLISSYVVKVKQTTNHNEERILKAVWQSRKSIPFQTTFAEYVEHLLFHPGYVSTIEGHWALYLDLCQPCHIQYDVVAQLETIDEDSRYFFALVGAPRNVTFTGGSGKNGHSKTTNTQFQEYYSQITKPKFNALYSLYRPDFELFGYPKPDQTG